MRNRCPPDLSLAQKLAYSPCGLIYKNLILEQESKEYGACDFTINERYIKFRVGKITPTKKGQFVTLWKRVGDSSIIPYDMADPIDLFVVSVRKGEYFGQFVFPKTVLCEKAIVSKEKKGGKRAFRVYPPWDIVDSPQARNTQTWQLRYFFTIPAEANRGIVLIQKLFL